MNFIACSKIFANNIVVKVVQDMVPGGYIAWAKDIYALDVKSP